MIKFGKHSFKFLGLIACFFAFFLISGCGNSGSGDDSLSLNVYGFELEYNGKTSFEKVALKKDDMDEIIDLYQEVGNDSDYKDSLLIAEKYAQGLGANAFSQDNLDVLKNQGLTLKNIKKTQLNIMSYEEKINAVLVEYEITEGFVSDIPLLYVSQLFIPNEANMLLMSFITEDKTSHLNASNMLKNIK